VLQGLDAGIAADAVSFIESSAGTPCAGVVVGATAVLFPVDAGGVVPDLSYAVTLGTSRHLVTGLLPGGLHDVRIEVEGEELVVTIRTGTTQAANDGGVLVVNVFGGA
jgi:hypothetical protein